MARLDQYLLRRSEVDRTRLNKAYENRTQALGPPGADALLVPLAGQLRTGCFVPFRYLHLTLQALGCGLADASLNHFPRIVYHVRGEPTPRKTFLHRPKHTGVIRRLSVSERRDNSHPRILTDLLRI